MIASHDDILLRHIPVVVSDVGPKRVAATLSNTSGDNYPVLLDNQSQLSILHHTLLTNISPLSIPIQVKGIAGLSVVLHHKGKLAHFDIECYASFDPMMNILCYADVAAKHPITTTPDAFVVHLTGWEVKFVLNNKLYVAHFDDFVEVNLVKSKNIYFSSVSEMASLYNLKERKLAWEAWQFIQRSLVGSKEEAINLATNGNIRGINFTRKDIERAYIIYGKPVSSIQGRMTKMSIARAELEQTNNWEARPQTLTMDAMFVCTIPFFVTVTDSLGMTVVSRLAGRDSYSMLVQYKEIF